MKAFVSLIIVLNFIFPSWIFAAEHNLDEMIARRDTGRYADATTYSGESAENNYQWQPEMLCYNDIDTGMETCVIVFLKGGYLGWGEFYSKNPNTEAWSADGKKIGFFSGGGGTGRSRDTINPLPGSAGYDYRWVVNSDGTKMKALEGYGRKNIPDNGFQWAKTNPNVYYGDGDGSDEYHAELWNSVNSNVYSIYKMTINDENVVTAVSTVADTSSVNTVSKELMGVSSRDSVWWARDIGAHYYMTPTPPDNVRQNGFWSGNLEPTPSFDVHWGIARGYGPSDGGADGYINQNRTEIGVTVTKGADTIFHVSDGTDYWSAQQFYTENAHADWDNKSWHIIDISGNDLTCSEDSSAFADPTGGSITIAANGQYVRSGKGIGLDFDYVSINPGSPNLNPEAGFIMKRTGGASDGGPVWEDWDGDSFGTNEEIIAHALGGSSGARYAPGDPYDNEYPGHGYWDRWGRFEQAGLAGDGGRAGTAIFAPFDRKQRGLWAGPSVSAIWEASTSYTVGDKVYPKDRFFSWALECTVSGESGVTEPTWNNTIGSSTVDGAATWKTIAWFMSTPGVADGAHRTWSAWSDRLVMHRSTDDIQELYVTNINIGYIGETKLSNTGTNLTGAAYNYTAYPRPTQSPDGTKVVFAHSFLNNNSATGVLSPYIAYVVDQYPYPPEIYSTAATGGTVTVRFDWGTDSGTWRGYTQRKWPDEVTGEYLPPRETSKFRLWRSTSASGPWTPITTVDADIWIKYDFVSGGYKGGQTSYWDITDTPGDGTFYYMVTAEEHSGLSSRQPSNIYVITVSSGSGSGSQDTVYPAEPGGLTPFTAAAPSAPQNLAVNYQKPPATAAGQYTIEWTEPADTTLVRYYNIYAQDNTAPTAVQQRRIASISRNICSGGDCLWVDWLGNTDNETKYGITTVNVLGIESGIVTLGGSTPAGYLSGATMSGGGTLR